MTLDIGRRLAQLETRIRQVERQSRLSSASLDDTALQVYDGGGGLRALVGQQADGTTAANIVNGPPPPTPSTPIGLSVLGGVAVSWDGAFTGGAVLPLDWQRIEVHASPVNGFTPDTSTLRATIETPRGATVIVPTDVDVYLLLLARSTSGTPSTASAQAGPYGPAPVVADDILDGIVTETKLAAEAVTAAKIKLGAIGADQLALGIGNIAPDPSFEGLRTAALITGLTDWTVVAPGNTSPKALHVDCTAGAISWKNLELGRFPVLPGERHFLALDYRVSAGFDGTTAKILFRYEDADGVVTGYGVADETPALGGAWDRATAQVQAPTGTVTARLQVEASEVTAGWVEFDNIEVRTLIVGGMVLAASITANELAANSVTTAKLDALAVTAEKISALAVTAAKLDALAVTTAKLDANAVTASKIQAGAVDATALAADAITGKTITGGTITGTLIQTDTTGQRITINEADANKIIVYDATGRAVGELSDAGVLLEGENGALIHLDPDGTYPNLRLTNDDRSNQAVINVVENTAGSANLGLNSGTFTANGYSDMKWRTFLGEDFWAAERFRESDSATVIGGRLYMNGTSSHLLFVNSATPSQNSGIDIAANIAQCNSRLEVLPPNASALSALFVNAASGHTGNMVRVQKNLVDQFVVDNSGNASITGTLSVGDTSWSSYTPTVAGSGTATFSTRDGWYFKIGKAVFVQTYIALSAAGTGSGTVTISLPSTPYRGSANRRQYLPAYSGGIVAGTNSGVGGTCVGNINFSGSGAIIDQLRGPTDILIRGDNLGATSIITLSGWYREA
ncbi:hypothetical protein AB0D12_31610 [Streptomyces sp. NPDC048479]|uniref:hypothetical protein n=1 Tax=Streptomyces sp. NPDC048479 TaxID=3154725 RepID=UPI003446ECB4